MNGVSVKTIEMSFEYFLLSNNLEMLICYESEPESGRSKNFKAGKRTVKKFETQQILKSERSGCKKVNGPKIK